VPNIKLQDEVYDVLLRAKNLLSLKEGKNLSFNDAIAWLLNNAPEIRVPLEEGLRVESEETPSEDQKVVNQ